MKLHDLKPNEGAHKDRKRKGRGTGSGYGNSSGRGRKGQKSRTSGGVRLYHQGGNLPYFRKLPFMRGVGFRSINRVRYAEVNLEKLSDFPADTEITPEILLKSGIINDLRTPVKILGRGEVSVALTVKAHKISASAKDKIESAGGSVVLIQA
ncbi:MAG TPA: 50S ribosomal protein L15 [Brevefilum sp.]|nr:50S ribosomal protein L15 [Brevefilum sp.]HOR19990.1 50S ribosomal protein L15 [Brevefilum sp.]HPL68796.1 50S ribosomal protein L15 [Brevefilum sp.]